MFYEHCLKFNTSFSKFRLFAPITDRAIWSSLDETWSRETVTLGERYLGFDFPALTAKDFMDFLHTGNRSRYEDKCFSKRHALDALILAECVENQGRFMDDIVNGIFSICEESAWQLPAHNSYIRDTPQLLLPDVTAPVLDLFACETGAILGCAYYLLQEKFDEYSPFITKRIRHELSHRIFTPYLTSHFWWMGRGDEPMNNWTIWCTQNVLLATFLTDTDEALRQDIFKKACKSTDYFLKEYGNDGCCDEGAQYYRHAGLCLFNVLEVLNAVTAGFFAPMYEEEKIKNIASYILNAHIQDKYYVNFADCSPVAGRCSVREYLFAIRTNNNAMKQFAALDYCKGGMDSLLLPKENNLYYRLQNAFYAGEIKDFALTCDEKEIVHPDIYYPSVGLFAVRDSSLYLAVKAGDNDDSHNHNDTGSFTVYKNGTPLLIDIGVESYTKKTFSPQRYEIWTMQSCYHNLPTINGFDQQNGASYKAKEVRYELGDSLCEIEMDITDAYPKECGISYYKRHAKLVKGQGIEIRDSFSPCNELTLHFMTSEKPVVNACETTSGITFTIGESTLSLSSGKLLEIEEFPITDERLKLAWTKPLYRISVTVDGAEKEVLMKIH